MGSFEGNIPRNPFPPHTTSFFFAAEAMILCGGGAIAIDRG
jgi:hypothetical protein